MSNTFGVLAGSLALESKPFHLLILDEIKRAYSQANGYVAYKMTRLGRVSDDDVPSFIVITREHGVLLVDVVEERILDAGERDGVEFWRTDSGATFTARSLVIELYIDEVVSRLKNDLRLYDRRTRSLRVPVTSTVVFCRNSDDEVNLFYRKFAEYGTETLVKEEARPRLSALAAAPAAALSDDEHASICALLEGTFVYQQRGDGFEENALRTRNDFIQRSLRITFKQDEAQRIASMQLPPGPQRIRGLAGTGKTIVLSLKAAITHARFEDYKILYLFNTQSMYQQVQSLIARHYTMQAKKAPEFVDHMHVLHAWGGRQKPGLYSTICERLGLRPMTWAEARFEKDSLAFIYGDLLKRAGGALEPIYDLVLIDEAQDFPDEVFQVVYKLTKGEGQGKRIIWAYDEFQSLRDTQMREPSEMFGLDANGRPNIPNSALEGMYPGEISKDFVLPNCYRTPRPILMAAHGVAMGLYTSSPNEMFFNRRDWEALGYTVNSPADLFIEAGDHVELERENENSKNILENLLREEGWDPLRLIKINQLATNQEQLDYVAMQVRRLMDEHEVPPEEIVVVNLRSGDNKASMLEMQRALTALSIRSVVPGYVESADVFKPKGSVTITTPFRAKGNEANIVFVINAEGVSLDRTLRMRNAFFVALTRSRGWCYITGVGPGVSVLMSEIDRIKQDMPKFKFVCPSANLVRKNKSFLSLSDKQADNYRRISELLKNNPELMDVVREDLFDALGDGDIIGGAK